MIKKNQRSLILLIFILLIILIFLKFIPILNDQTIADIIRIFILSLLFATIIYFVCLQELTRRIFLSNRLVLIKGFLRRYGIWLILGTFFIFYNFITVSLHNLFLTYGGDLGVFDQIVWNLSHFRPAMQTFHNISGYLSNGFGQNFFSEHFSPILFLVAPFYWIWSDPRMLILLQNFIFVLGALPIYLLIIKETKNYYLGFCLAIIYLLYIGNQAALYFPVHFQVFALTFLAFAFYFARQNKKMFYLFIILALCCQENIAIYIIFLGLYFIFFTKEKKLGLITTGLGIVWLVGVVYILIPNIFHNKYPYPSFYYQQFGNTLSEQLLFFLKNPLVVLRQFFQIANLRIFLTMGIGFGLLFLGAPIFYFLGLPVLLENFLSNNVNMHIMDFHYWSFFSLALILGTYYILKSIKQKSPKLLLFSITFVFISNIISNIIFLPQLRSSRILKPSYYKVFLIRAGPIQELLKYIPANASVSAQAQIYPHLSERKEIYQFPIINNADYIILADALIAWPLSSQEYIESVNNLLNSKSFYLDKVVTIDTTAKFVYRGFIFKRR